MPARVEKATANRLRRNESHPTYTSLRGKTALPAVKEGPGFPAEHGPQSVRFALVLFNTKEERDL